LCLCIYSDYKAGNNKGEEIS